MRIKNMLRKKEVSENTAREHGEGEHGEGECENCKERALRTMKQNMLRKKE